MCFQRTTVSDAFNRADNPVYGWSRIDSLPNIGSYLRQQLAQHNILTVNDFLAATRQHFTLARMAQFVASLVPNQNQHKCVSSDAGRYHVSDVNTCGYNTLIRTIQFAHTERRNYQAYGFNRRYTCSFARDLELRHRGTQLGSRYCSCYNNQKTCRLHSDACRWSKSEKVCIPDANPAQIDDQAGFLGAANRRHQFRRGFRNRLYHARRYKRNWQLPALQGGYHNQPQPPQPPHPPHQPHQPQPRRRNPDPNNQSLKQYVLQFERQHNKKFGLLRQFYKFVR